MSDIEYTLDEIEIIRLKKENAIYRDAFDEVCCDIRNHAPNYVHPLEVNDNE